MVGVPAFGAGFPGIFGGVPGVWCRDSRGAMFPGFPRCAGVVGPRVVGGLGVGAGGPAGVPGVPVSGAGIPAILDQQGNKYIFGVTAS